MSDRDSIHNEPDECGAEHQPDDMEPDHGAHVCVAPEGHTDWHTCPCGETWP